MGMLAMIRQSYRESKGDAPMAVMVDAAINLEMRDGPPSSGTEGIGKPVLNRRRGSALIVPQIDVPTQAKCLKTCGLTISALSMYRATRKTKSSILTCQSIERRKSGRSALG